MSETATDMMIDLETLGTSENAMIVSIGACLFDFNGIVARHYSVIDIERPTVGKYDIDLGTVKWWMKQNDEARAVFNSPVGGLSDALIELRQFAHSFGATTKDLKVWGNGASFDNVILRNAYDKEGIASPWKYWNDRCYRTLKNMFRHVPCQREGTPHNALDDAVTQAQHLRRILDFEDMELA